MQTTTTLAAEFDTTPRTLRKFLRATDMGVGKGSRYSLPTAKREVAKMKKQFNAWQEAANAKKATDKVDEAPAAPEVDEVIEAEVEGPTDEDLAALEAELDD